MYRLIRRATILVQVCITRFWNKNFAQFTIHYFSIGEDIDHANVIFRTGPRATYMVLAGNLVPAGTPLVTPALISPWGHFSIHFMLLRRPRRSSKPSPMLLVWQWIGVHPARPENTEESHPITNLKPRPFANTTVTSNKVKDFTRKLLFLLKFIWYKRNDVTTNKLSNFLSVADVANQAKFVFSWPAWVVYGFAIATKGSKSHSHQ